jgi:hypothetical protein
LTYVQYPALLYAVAPGHCNPSIPAHDKHAVIPKSKPYEPTEQVVHATAAPFAENEPGVHGGHSLNEPSAGCGPYVPYWYNQNVSAADRAGAIKGKRTGGHADAVGDVEPGGQ